jgi:hypothetical protein
LVVLGADMHERSHTIAAVGSTRGELLGERTVQIGVDSLNEPASDPDPTEWPDPYDKRPDPRNPEEESEELDFGDIHTPTGATSTSTPNHDVDLEVEPRQSEPARDDKSG